MKTRIHLWLVACTLILGVYACAEPAKTPENANSLFAQPEGDTMCGTAKFCHQCDSMDRESNSCSGDRLVKDSCAKSWAQAWVDGLKTTGDSLDNARFFKKTKLDTLLGACKDCESVRIYFGLNTNHENNQMVLMMVNVKKDNCDDDYTTPNKVKGPVLSSRIDERGNGHQDFISTESAQAYVNNWADTYYGTDAEYLTVNSYTFNRDKLIALRDASREKIVVSLAVHHVRKICQCNYDFRDLSEGEVIDLVIRPDQADKVTGKAEYLDFAAPCPRRCGGTMLLQ